MIYRQQIDLLLLIRCTYITITYYFIIFYQWHRLQDCKFWGDATTQGDYNCNFLNYIVRVRGSSYFFMKMTLLLVGVDYK